MIWMTALLMMAQAGAAADPLPAVAAASGLGPVAGDALRFTDIAPGGRAATAFDARRTAAGTERTIVVLTAGADGWAVQSRDTRRLAGETFDYMAGRLDVAIAAHPSAAGACPDGSDYLSERSRGGIVSRLAGCGEGHPNIAIARLFGVREAE